jgi:hypothetical protein
VEVIYTSSWVAAIQSAQSSAGRQSATAANSGWLSAASSSSPELTLGFATEWFYNR